jgi:hypothetical protein
MTMKSQCEVLAPLRHAQLGSFFLEPEDINSQTLGAIWCCSKVAGLPWVMFGAQRAGLIYRPRCIRADGPQTLLPI